MKRIKSNDNLIGNAVVLLYNIGKEKQRIDNIRKWSIKMLYYAAPMEGITGYVYRNAHHHFFRGTDKYFTPFLTPKRGKGWTSREKNDILPDHNQGIKVVPQILTNQPEDFIRMAKALEDCGYEEINLNLGCPSGTVVAKGKGCGFLADPEVLRQFFEAVFQEVTVKVSVKTRLGLADPEEIVKLMEIYNQFPLEEVIIHARIHKDFYRRPVNREAFRKAFLMSSHPVCYNGDIFTVADFEEFHREFPEVDRVMFGRGLTANPQLIEQIRYGDTPDKKRWQAFHDEVCLGYEEIMSGERNVLFKMKELWNYMIPEFEDAGKIAKKIKKSVRLQEYKIVVDNLFREHELKSSCGTKTVLEKRKDEE